MSLRQGLQKVVKTNFKMQRGSITQVGRGFIMVSTPNGLKEFKTESTNYKVGESVRFQGGALLGVIPSGLEGIVHVV